MKEQRVTSLPWQRSLCRRSGRSPPEPYPPHKPGDCITNQCQTYMNLLRIDLSSQMLTNYTGHSIREKVDILFRDSADILFRY